MVKDMIKIKKFLSFIVIVLVVFTFGLNCERITEELEEYIYKQPEIIIQPGNGFNKKFEYLFVKGTPDYIPESKQELIEIFYTILNKGWDEFTFYCPKEYSNCLDDVASLSRDLDVLANLNNFVSSYNAYDTIKTIYDTTGEVTVSVGKVYNEQDIYNIEEKVNSIIANYINDGMSDYDKIRTIHDYIINNTKYDTLMADTQNSNYDSKRINGVLFQGYGICSGYADTMEIFLTKFNIPNYKISSENHVWNAVYINDNWVHLDVTWDDPTTNTGEDMLLHDYFLIDDSKLYINDDVNLREHTYNYDVFLEFKKAQ